MPCRARSSMLNLRTTWNFWKPRLKLPVLGVKREKRSSVSRARVVLARLRRRRVPSVAPRRRSHQPSSGPWRVKAVARSVRRRTPARGLESSLVRVPALSSRALDGDRAWASGLPRRLPVRGACCPRRAPRHAPPIRLRRRRRRRHRPPSRNCRPRGQVGSRLSSPPSACATVSLRSNGVGLRTVARRMVEESCGCLRKGCTS